MKACCLCCFVVVFTANAWAQGQFTFGNRVGVPESIDAPVFDADCQTRLEGSAFLWQVYAGFSPEVLQPLGMTSPFRTGAAAGYIDSTTYAVPGASHGTIVYTQLRAWDAAAGGSYEAAVAAGVKYGFSNILPVSTVVGTPPPRFPVGLESFCLIPEPSTLTLFGYAAVLAAFGWMRPR